MITGPLERRSREARSRVSGSQARGWRGRRTIRFFVSSPDVSLEGGVGERDTQSPNDFSKSHLSLGSLY